MTNEEEKQKKRTDGIKPDPELIEEFYNKEELKGD
jgi:hypothetical protein